MKPKILVISSDLALLPDRPPSRRALRTHTIVHGLEWHGCEVTLSVPKAAVDAHPTAPPALGLFAHEPGQLTTLVERLGPEVVLVDDPALLDELVPSEIGLVVDLALSEALDHADAVLGQVDVFLTRDTAQQGRVTEQLRQARLRQLDRRVIVAPFAAPLDEPPQRQRRTEPTIVAWWCGVSGPPRAALGPLLGVLEERAVGRLELVGPEVKFIPDAPRVIYHGELSWRALCTKLAQGWVGLQLDAPSTGALPAMHTLVDLWCGLPPIVGREHPMAEHIATAGAGWIVDPDDPDALAELTSTLIGPPERVDHASRAAQALAVGHGWDDTAQPLVAFCHQPGRLVDRPAAAPQGRGLGSQSSVVMAAELGTTLAELSAKQADTMKRLTRLADSMSETRERMEFTLSQPTPPPIEQEKAIGELRKVLIDTRAELNSRLEQMATYEARAEASEEERLAQAASLADRNAELGAARERAAEMAARIQRETERVEREAARVAEETARADQLAERLEARERALEEAREAAVTQSKQLHEATADRDRQADQVAAFQRENTRLGELAADADNQRERADAERERADHADARASRLAADVEGARRHAEGVEAELARLRAEPAYRFGRRLAPVFTPAGALSLLVVVLLVLLVLPPETLDPVEAYFTAHPWAVRGLIALGVLCGLAVIYKLRHRLPAWATFKWRWLTPTRARWLGSLKLALLFVVSMVLMVYVKLWELVRRPVKKTT